jgi:hypothetical protein
MARERSAGNATSAAWSAFWAFWSSSAACHMMPIYIGIKYIKRHPLVQGLGEDLDASSNGCCEAVSGHMGESSGKPRPAWQIQRVVSSHGASPSAPPSPPSLLVGLGGRLSDGLFDRLEDCPAVGHYSL